MHQRSSSEIILRIRAKWSNIFHVNIYTLLHTYISYATKTYICLTDAMGGRRSNDTVGTRLLYSLARYITMSINCDDLDICIINFHGIIIKLYWICQSAKGELRSSHFKINGEVVLKFNIRVISEDTNLNESMKI